MHCKKELKTVYFDLTGNWQSENKVFRWSIFALSTSDGRSFDGINSVNIRLLGDCRQTIEDPMRELADKLLLIASRVAMEADAIGVAHSVYVIRQRRD